MGNLVRRRECPVLCGLVVCGADSLAQAALKAPGALVGSMNMSMQAISSTRVSVNRLRRADHNAGTLRTRVGGPPNNRLKQTARGRSSAESRLRSRAAA